MISAISPADLAPHAIRGFACFYSSLWGRSQDGGIFGGLQCVLFGSRASQRVAEMAGRCMHLPPRTMSLLGPGHPRLFAKGAISACEMGSVMGKLVSAKTDLFVGFARSQLRPLYRKHYARRWRPNIVSPGRMARPWRAPILSAVRPRIPPAPSCRPGFAIYTDASTSSGRIAALRMRPGEESPIVPKICVSAAPSLWVADFAPKKLDRGRGNSGPFGLPMACPNAAPRYAANLYFDSDSDGNALFKGRCANPIYADTIGVLRKPAEKLPADVRIFRVGANVGPSELPTRFAHLPCRALKRSQFTNRPHT